MKESLIEDTIGVLTIHLDSNDKKDTHFESNELSELSYSLKLVPAP
jgi:hypothetical protein